jgi:hypothetical protein
MRMLSGSTLAHVGKDAKRAWEKEMVDVGLMEDLQKCAWGYRHPRWMQEMEDWSP